VTLQVVVVVVDTGAVVVVDTLEGVVVAPRI
jgi:hypothetical protein